VIKIPKYELHVHLAGSIRRQTLVDLAEKNAVQLPVAKKDFLKAPSLLEISEADEPWELFHNIYKWSWSCVKTCEDLERIVIEFLEDSYDQGVVYSEFTVSGSYLMNTFPLDEWTDAVNSGIKRIQKTYAIRAAAILDISRRFGPEKALENVKLVHEAKPKGLCGIGMGGDEVKYPHHLFKEAFAYARENKIPSTIHVGEFTDGINTISAIEDLKPNRLGHALTTYSSEEAHKKLIESGLHVETCPTCNYMAGMGGLTKLSDHPIKKYYEEGVPISINTDDPGIFGYDLVDTYVALMKECDFTIEDFRKINDKTAKYIFQK